MLTRHLLTWCKTLPGRDFERLAPAQAEAGLPNVVAAQAVTPLTAAKGRYPPAMDRLLRESWSRTEQALDAAVAAMPDLAADELVEYREYREHNELGLAFDVVASLADEQNMAAGLPARGRARDGTRPERPHARH